MDDSRPKASLLAKIRTERARWEELLTEVGDARLTDPGVAGAWSVKDVLGHLAAFDRAWGARLRSAATGVPPTTQEMFGVDALPEGAESWTEDEENAAIHAHYAPLAPEVVVATWREASHRLEEAVAALSEDDLSTPGRFPWAGDRPLAAAMAGDTFDHAAEHAAGVRVWLDRPE